MTDQVSPAVAGLWHRHKYQPVGVEHYEARYGPNVTVVLWRCPCGKVRTRRLDGLWAIEQIRDGERGTLRLVKRAS